MLIGNKCDMADRRMVSRERGDQIAADHGIRFLETSAKTNVNVDKAFYDLAAAILDKVSLSLFRTLRVVSCPLLAKILNRRLPCRCRPSRRISRRCRFGRRTNRDRAARLDVVESNRMPTFYNSPLLL